MASDGAAATPAKATPKKANLLDLHSIKHLLDETISDVLHFTLNSIPTSPSSHLAHVVLSSDDMVSGCYQVVKSKGYSEDTRLSNWKLGIGAAVIAVALLAQFYPKKFPQNRELLLGCIALYPFFTGFNLPLCWFS
jgi:signal peptidase complex subunit 2